MWFAVLVSVKERSGWLTTGAVLRVGCSGSARWVLTTVLRVTTGAVLRVRCVWVRALGTSPQVRAGYHGRSAAG